MFKSLLLSVGKCQLKVMNISIVVSPFHCGRRGGSGDGPHAILSAGLESELYKLGCSVEIVEVEPVDHLDGEMAQMFQISRCISNLVSQACRRGCFPLILAGNFSCSVGVAAAICDTGVSGGDLGCVWFDAHDDIHTPDTITSGYGDSTALSLLTGNCYKRMLHSVLGYQVMKFENFIHVGLRDVDDHERELVRQAELDVVWGGVGNTGFITELAGKLQDKRLRDTMVHVDLDCLDSSDGWANKLASCGGLSVDDLAGCLKEVASCTKPTSLTLASFDPSFKGRHKVADAAIHGVKAFLQTLMGDGPEGT